ncbi:MAG: AmmeMemoRadiSam system protein B [Treponema sp.]|nr:AmmeMemoRadiSam system protein B [Treponema sp.]
MKIREPILADSWYPVNPKKVDEFLAFASDAEPTAPAAIAPHAGWFYSGKIAARSVSCLKRDADTVVIIGGHLPAGAPYLFAEEDAVRTPYGPMFVDTELREALSKKLKGRSDVYQDNTVEVQLPMIHSFFPDAKVLWVRFPAAISAFEAGIALAETAGTLGRSIAVLGSTDLTHYGVNYGFTSHGSGKAALDWVRNTNDAGFINAVLKNDPPQVLACAEKHAACSAGAVLGVMGFTGCRGGLKSELLEYGTSADAEKPNVPQSFVGYASIAWKQC